MALRIDFNRSACTAREAQLIDALIATHMSFRGGLLRAAGLSASDPNHHLATVEFTTQFMRGAFPDLEFHTIEIEAEPTTVDSPPTMA
jgi:hypothetical protein